MSRFKNLAFFGAGVAFCALIFAGIANFYDHTKTTTGGGIGVVSGSEVQGTFWYYAIIFTLIWYSIALLIHYKSRKNA